MSARYTYGLAFPHRLPDASGVAHVVEHLVGHGPRGSQTRYLMPALVDRGVLESFTGLTYRGFTAYVFTGRSESMDIAVELVLQSCLDPVLDREAIAIELGRPVGDQWRPGVVEDEVTLRYTWLREAVAAVTAAVHPDDALSHRATVSRRSRQPGSSPAGAGWVSARAAARRCSRSAGSSQVAAMTGSVASPLTASTAYPHVAASNRGYFPTGDAAIKLIWLAIADIEDKRAAEAGKARNQSVAPAGSSKAPASRVGNSLNSLK